MEITELNKIPGIEQNKKLSLAYNQFNKLLIELRKQDLPSEITTSINYSVEGINNHSGTEKDVKNHIKKAQTGIVKLIEKELKLVPKKHYQTTWLALGMAVFGIPLGVAFGASLDNMAFIGIGIPIGMAIGIAVGTGMDKKAFEEGRQLDLELES